MTTLLDRVASHGTRVAILEGNRSWTFRDVDEASRRVAATLCAGRSSLSGARIGVLATPRVEYVASLLGVWRAGGIAVPLGVTYPRAELEYLARDAEAETLVAAGPADPACSAAKAVGARFITFDDLLAGMRDAPAAACEAIPPAHPALVLYTSGTTGRPKGVITTHANIAAQIESLVAAWEWSERDRVLLALPLHHLHGLINVVGCSLWSGAVCDVLARFDAEVVWSRLAAGNVTVFTGVPTMYQRLIASWDRATPAVRDERSSGCRRARLMMCGSAALPVTVLQRWRDLSGHVLLERYGMTEIGMALSNPLHGERRPGFVGTPLPGVEARLVDEQGNRVSAGTPGELEVRGPAVFQEYWRQPRVTHDAFRDGWFRTGDVAVLEDGAYRLIGRTSVDIIKTGGEKISALEIEEVVRLHPSVADCAVVGVSDPQWGERVCLAVELRPHTALSLEELQEWTRARVAPAKVPKALVCVGSLPRNVMGKIIKPAVAALFS